MAVLINVKEFKFDSFSRRQQHPFRLNRGVAAESVDTALTRTESENRKQLKINYLRFLGVPRTELQILQLATLNYTYKYPVLQLITKYNCEFQFR